MGRPALPHGRHVTISAKVSDAQLAAIDAARGQLSRSAWLASAAAAAAPPAASSAATPATETSPVPARAPRTRQPKATAVKCDPCPHRGLQAGAYCRACESTVPGRQP